MAPLLFIAAGSLSHTLHAFLTLAPPHRFAPPFPIFSSFPLPPSPFPAPFHSLPYPSPSIYLSVSACTAHLTFSFSPISPIPHSFSLFLPLTHTSFPLPFLASLITASFSGVYERGEVMICVFLLSFMGRGRRAEGQGQWNSGDQDRRTGGRQARGRDRTQLENQRRLPPSSSGSVAAGQASSAWLASKTLPTIIICFCLCLPLPVAHHTAHMPVCCACYLRAACARMPPLLPLLTRAVSVISSEREGKSRKKIKAWHSLLSIISRKHQSSLSCEELWA